MLRIFDPHRVDGLRAYRTHATLLLKERLPHLRSKGASAIAGMRALLYRGAEQALQLVLSCQELLVGDPCCVLREEAVRDESAVGAECEPGGLTDQRVTAAASTSTASSGTSSCVGYSRRARQRS